MKDQPEDWQATRAEDFLLSDGERAEAGSEIKSYFAATILTISGKQEGIKSKGMNLLLDPL